MDKPEKPARKEYLRRFTREVTIGNTGIGGNNPVRVQSMTSTPTLDTRATVDQILRISSAGAELVRMTVQNIREAENLKNIKSELRSRKCFIPLVADVHFNPAIAELAASVVDKVRINPGNYGISRGKVSEALSEESGRQEMPEARTAFLRLLDICRNHGTALRIGVNHGSLSPRIINHYGNTPEGMVFSAMEFLRFCAEQDFHNVVVSLKSSNTLLMVRANRLMVKYMENEGMAYPLHLGVTEAGEGEDGRIRSVAGIGTLLWEGTGDTVRVSLTEDPEREVPVARKMLELIDQCRPVTANRDFPDKYSGAIISGNIDPYSSGGEHELSESIESSEAGSSGDPFTGRRSFRIGKIGGDQVPVVIGETDVDRTGSGVNSLPLNSEDSANSGLPAADFFYQGGELYRADSNKLISFPLVGPGQYLKNLVLENTLFFLQVSVNDLTDELLAKAAADKRLVFVAISYSDCPLPEMKSFIKKLNNEGCNNPVIFKKEYSVSDTGNFQMEAATGFAPLFLDKLGDGLWLVNHAGAVSPDKTRPDTENIFSSSHQPEAFSPTDLSRAAVSTAFSILQSTRVRTTRTEFISCPSCGRTMFNIKKATEAVKTRTSHLKGLKIAVMGCIVNGPGEMADADYGYVGSGRGRVSLYKKQTVIKRNVPEENAVEELIKLIKDSGDWREG